MSSNDKDLELEKLKEENKRLSKAFEEQKIKATILQNTVWKLLEQVEKLNKKGQK